MSDDEDNRKSANIAVLVAVAIVVVLGVILMSFLSSHLKTERCLEERRRDCVPVTDQ
ncbi:MAG TPA: hypothetical protein VJ476_15395 [Rhizomicrobium sp.]|nr:hypothetical protein [Rhizomicrobium sp.]